MKALIERPIHLEGAMTEWHRARADVARDRDVSVVSARPARQRGGHGSGVRCGANAGALRTHTNSDSLAGAPPGCGNTGCIFHTCIYSMCFCVHGGDYIMYTIYSLYLSRNVFVPFMNSEGK